MFKKEYYRLDDLENKFNVTASDIRYLVENSNISLAFHLTSQKFIYGGWLKGKGFVGHGVATYTGLVGISELAQQALVETGEAELKQFKLLNRVGLHSIDTKYPFDLKTPNNYLDAWQSKPVELLNWRLIPAKLFPKVQDHPVHMFSKIIKEGVSAFTQNDVKEFEMGTSNHLKAIPEKELYAKELKIVFSDVCVQHKELERLGIYKDASEIESKATDLQPSKAKFKFKNQFHELLADILINNKAIKTKEIHRLLCKEATTAEDDRQYDRRNILLDNVDGTIVWSDIHSKKREKTCAYNVLGNHLTDVRKVLYPR